MGVCERKEWKEETGERHRRKGAKKQERKGEERVRARKDKREKKGFRG